MPALSSLKSGWSGALLALLGGALTVPAFAPWNIWPLVLPGLLILFWLLEDAARAAPPCSASCMPLV